VCVRFEINFSNRQECLTLFFVIRVVATFEIMTLWRDINVYVVVIIIIITNGTTVYTTV